MAANPDMSRNPIPGTGGRSRAAARALGASFGLAGNEAASKEKAEAFPPATPAAVFLRAVARVLADADADAARQFGSSQRR